jgi:starch synthase (maltosyl-transferring)
VGVQSPDGARTSITFLITELDPGGAERALVQIATGLSPDDWKRSVICLSDRGALASTLEESGIPVTCLGARRASSLQGLWKATAGLTRELHRQQPAVLQTFLWHANIVGRIAARRTGVPHVVSGIRVAEKRGRWRLRLDRWTERYIDRHVCVSQAVADFSIRESGLSPQKTVVIPNGVDLETFRNADPVELSSFGIPNEATVLLSVGRLDPQKDPLTLIRATGRLARDRPDLHLLLIGQGTLEEEIAQAAEAVGIADRVHLAGWQSDIAGIMRSADLLVLTSLWEGLPNVLLEAGASGLPIVATQAEGVSEIVEDGVTGRLVTIGDEQALAAAIDHVLNDPVAAAESAERLQRQMAERFTWPAVVTQYADLYRSLLAAGE